MKMKKIISAILSASIITASAAVPVLADYSAGEYDVVAQDTINYNDDAEATETNTIDGSKAKLFPQRGKSTDKNGVEYLDNGKAESVFRLAKDTTVFSNGFFLTFDVKFNTINGDVPGLIGIARDDDGNGRNFKQGPNFHIVDGQLVTDVAKGDAPKLGAVSADTWYTIELEGYMVEKGANVTFRLFGYEGGTKTQIGSDIQGLDLRQFYSEAPNGKPNELYASEVSVDNIRLISQNPDEITVLSDKNEVDAGQSATLSYTMQRKGVTLPNQSVTYSLYDENNTSELTSESGISISNSILTADIKSAAQTITVRATAKFGSKELTGTKQIKINAVDTENEKFNKIAVNGDETLNAGTSLDFTVTASKDGGDVTGTLSAGDVVWSIYNYNGLEPNNNKNISIAGGKLTVADGVLPQTVYVRASSSSGKVFGQKAVTISWSDSQPETVVESNPCETAIDNATAAEAPDGSNGYLITSQWDWKFGNQSGFTLAEMDIRFGNNSAGVTVMRNDLSKINSTVSLSSITGGDTDSWYHIELLYSDSYAAFNYYKYNSDGTLGERETKLDIDRRNKAQFGALRFAANTYVDNIKVVKPAANDLKLTASAPSVFAGETLQLTASQTRNGLPLGSDPSAVTWNVYDAGKLPIIDGSVTVDASKGILSAAVTAPEQTVTVEASTASGAKATVEVEIQSSEIFKMKKLGVNEEGTKIVKLYVDKNFYYQDDVTFIMAFYKSGKLCGVRTMKSYASNYVIGENQITVDWDFPEGYDTTSETDTAEMFIWTTFN